MKASSFEPLLDLILVKAMVWGPRNRAPLTLVLDTGSSHTVLAPELMDTIGFNPRDGLAITSVYTALGKEQGYMLKVPRFEALGFALTDFPIHVFDLADRYDIDGVIGLSFLHRFNYTVRSADGQLLVEPVGPHTGAVPVG